MCAVVVMSVRSLAAACRKARTMARLRQLDLEGVVAEALGVAQDALPRPARKCLRVARLARQQRLGLRVAPGLVRHAAQREARLRDRVAVHLQRGGDRHQREGVGRAVADLQVGVVCRRSPWRADRPP